MLIYWILHNVLASPTGGITGWCDISTNAADVAPEIYQLPSAPWWRDRSRHVLCGSMDVTVPDGWQSPGRMPLQWSSDLLSFELVDALAWAFVSENGLHCPTIPEVLAMVQQAAPELVDVIGGVESEIVQPLIDRYVALGIPVEMAGE